MAVAQQEMQSLLRQALSAQQSGDLAAAEQACRQALVINADEPNALQFLGLIHRQKGDEAEAERLMLRSLAVAPDQPHVLNNLGNLLSGQGRSEDALEVYTKAVSLNKDYQEAWRNLGLVQTTMGLLDEARASLTAALDLNAGDVHSLNALGIVHKELEEYDEAIKNYQAALAIQPSYLKAIHNMGVTLKLAERPGEAVEWFIKALRLDPTIPEVHYNMANALYEKGDAPAAIAGYEKAIEIQADYIPAHETLNQYYWEFGEHDKFTLSYPPAIKRAGQSAELRVAYAKSLELSGDVEAARDVLVSGLAETGEHAGLYHRLGRAEAALGNENASERNFENAIRMAPRDQDIRLDYARMLIRNAAYGLALEHLEAVEAENPYEQLMWAYRGLCWRFLGDEREAWLNDYDTFVQARMMETPPGYDNLEHFLERLKEVLISMHRTTTQPLDQTLLGGTQTQGRLLHKPVKEIQELRQALDAQVMAYVRALPDDPDHPFLGRKTNAFRFTGSWSVRLKSEGFHVNHVHPAGWISGPTYIEVPSSITEDDPERQGWVKFGESGLDLGPEREIIAKAVRPVPGLVALFPSYTWHGTFRFYSDEYRMTAPFDGVPG
ncbi:MAG: tetratricopeptide repeat protein [Proteobacteria bacterium]|nr:tetratricopeptide repeat protein [Pseudomonadota bacterium]